MTVYDDLERKLGNLLDNFQEKPIEYKVQLGYNVDNKYSVVVSGDNSRYYIRLDNKSWATAYHNGICRPIPDLWVYVVKNQNNDYVITRVDHILAKESVPNETGSVTTGLHGHQRFSGLEFPIDNRLLSSFQIRPVSGLDIYINAGAYKYEGKFNWFGGDTINLSSSVPSTSGKQRWVILVLNQNSSTISAINGDLQSTTSPLTIEQIESIQLTGIPVGAIRLKYGQSSILETDMEALHILIDSYPKHNYNATTSPTVNDDELDGYGVSSEWYDQVTLIPYVCIDATAGAAIWVSGGGSGSSTPVTTTKKTIKTRIPLYTETLSVAGAFDVDMSSFEACDDLEIQLIVRATNNNNITINWAVNNDTTNANYRSQLLQGFNASPAASGTSDRNVQQVDGANSATNHMTVIEAFLYGYRSTSRFKAIYTRTALLFSTASSNLRNTFSEWLNTSAISRIAFAASAGNFAIGSSIAIWGIKEVDVVTEVSGTQSPMFPIEIDYAESILDNRQIVLSHVSIITGGSLEVNGAVVFTGGE